MHITYNNRRDFYREKRIGFGFLMQIAELEEMMTSFKREFKREFKRKSRKPQIAKGVTMIIMAIFMTAMLLMPSLHAASSVYAYEKIDTDRLVTLSIEFANGPKVYGMDFRAYKVANIDENGNFEFTEAISAYGLAMPDDQAGYRALAETLSSYVARDGINHVARAITNDEGKAYFGALEQGLYLVVADRFTDPRDQMTYIVQPSLVALPYSTDGLTWKYDVTVSPKYTSIPPLPSTGGEPTEINVIKVWSGESDQATRPTYIYAELICDGVVLDTVTLNSGNNWRYTWKDLDSTKTYNVTEKEVPAGYTVTITRDGNTFTLNNYKGDVPPKTPPKSPRLPNTGQLWWPVPILIASGLILLVLGKVRKQSS